VQRTFPSQRASPEHKLRLVKAIQANKQIVAMTRDGVNDAPSLKKADVGVAIGIKGSEVTKEAAETVLADVREGHTFYNNIEKAILFMLTDQRRSGARDHGGNLCRLYRTDHGAANPLGEYDDIASARARDLVRAARARRHAPFAPRT
jgi:hypothetical protein